MTADDVIKRRPLPVFYEYRPEQREAIRLWAQSWAGLLDHVIGLYLLAPAMMVKR